MGWQGSRANRRPSGNADVQLSAALRYWHTIRYLKPVQIYGRIWFRRWRPRINCVTNATERCPGASLQSPCARQQSLFDGEVFEFLNRRGSLEQVGWDDPEREKLWRYNQHYFYDLNAVGAEGRRSDHEALVERWIAENPPCGGSGWEPYPTSIRIVSWVFWFSRHESVPDHWLNSLATQARWLNRRIEWHLLGNHLFTNAKALVFAGCYLDGPEADQWLRRGLSILGSQIPEQILEDGGHFERSTMYHALALEDLLDLLNVVSVTRNRLPESLFVAGGFESINKFYSRLQHLADKMFTWLGAMTHPDGDIAFFNDAAFGIAPLLSDLQAYANRLDLAMPDQGRETLVDLRKSGYVRIADADAVLLVDVAPVGPDYLLGHAHADTLSFELSLFGRRVLVNSGTSLYGESTERHRQRATAAHNCVVVEKQNSSEVWRGFRVARRAKVVSRAVGETASGSYYIEGVHDGYRHLHGQVLHERCWRLGESALVLRDTLKGKWLEAMGFLHFHPDVTLTQIGERLVLGSVGDNVDLRVEAKDADLRVEAGSWHPGFGESLEASKIVYEMKTRECWLEVSWSPVKAEA